MIDNLDLIKYLDSIGNLVLINILDKPVFKKLNDNLDFIDNLDSIDNLNSIDNLDFIDNLEFIHSLILIDDLHSIDIKTLIRT